MKNKHRIFGEKTEIYMMRRDGRVEKTTIETSDLDAVMAFPGAWHITRRNGYDYVLGEHNKGKKDAVRIYLHRFLLDDPKGMDIDHINHDTLDNRRSNIRAVSHSENMQNRIGANKNSKTGVRGVYWNERHKHYLAQVTVRCRVAFSKNFKTLSEAEKAVTEARIKLHVC